MDLREYLRVVRHYWPVIAASVVVALGAAWFVRALQSGEPATGEVSQANVILVASGENAAFGLGIGTPNVEAVAAFVSLYDVAERAAERLRYEGDPRDLSAQVSASLDPESGLVNIVATASQPREAERLADAFADAVLDFLVDFRVSAAEPLIEQLETQIQQLRQADPESVLIDQYSAQLRALRVAQYDAGYARLEGGPARPAADAGFQPPRSFAIQAMIALLIGLALGFAIAVVLAKMDTRIRSKSGAEEAFELPVLAEIPLIPRAQRDALVSATHPASAPAEAFRLLGTEVARWSVHNGKGAATRSIEAPGALLVTSAGPSEGKTTVTANLAVAFAEMGKKVIVLSCDFRHPEIHRFFGVPNETGLTDALRSSNGRPLLSGRTHRTPYDSVSVVPSGPAEATPGALLSSDGMGKALAEARSAADVVLIDSAPILAVSDAAHLLPHVDAVLVVARAGKTRPDVAARTTEVLRRLGAPLLGVVLNASTEIPIPRDYRRYLRAGPGAGEDDAEMGGIPTYPVPPETDNV